MTRTTKFRNIRSGVTIWVRANFAQAASQIEYSLCGSQFYGSPLQVADARHYESRAIKLIADYLRGTGDLAR